MLSIDHVVLAVGDLDDAGERLRAEHGLSSVPGGLHPGWGTGNRIVPLGDDYVELISVVDPDVGRATPLGRALLELTDDGDDRWFAVCLADTDLEATAARLGLRVEPGSRTRPDGTEIFWRGAGVDDDLRAGWLPFFIAWDSPPELHPGRGAASHDAGVTGIAGIDLAGDPTSLREWLGPHGDGLPLRVVDGDRGVRTVELATDRGETIRL